MVVYSVSSLTVSFADLSQLSSGCPVDLDYLKAVMGSARLSYEFLVLYEIESTVETDVLKIQNWRNQQTPNKPIEKLVASVSSSILAKISQSFGNYPPISSPTLIAESSSASSDSGVSTAFCDCVFAISEASALIVFPGSSS